MGKRDWVGMREWMPTVVSISHDGNYIAAYHLLHLPCFESKRRWRHGA